MQLSSLDFFSPEEEKLKVDCQSGPQIELWIGPRAGTWASDWASLSALDWAPDWVLDWSWQLGPRTGFQTGPWSCRIWPGRLGPGLGPGVFLPAPEDF